MGVTLVAGYGPNKPAAFSDLLSILRNACGTVSELTGWIRLYDDLQVHATIVGLEGKRSGDSISQDNLRSRIGGTGPWPPINIAGLLDFLAGPVSDVSIVVGGFQKNTVNPFDPARTPFERSFDVRRDGLLVAMGWPHTGESFSASLIGVRKYMEKFNVVHKYHVHPHDQDNDLFFVIGEVNAERWQVTPQPEQATIQSAIDRLVVSCRQALAKSQRTMSFRLRELQLVKYERTSLAQTSFARSVSDVDVQTFVGLYDHPA
jgi:hypothetical protein